MYSKMTATVEFVQIFWRNVDWVVHDQSIANNAKVPQAEKM